MCIIGTPVFSATDTGAENKKVVMVIADYLDIRDIRSMEFTQRLSAAGYSALMSNRQPGRASAVKSKLIIGAGKKLELDRDMVSGGGEESLLKQYRLISGKSPVKGSLVYTDINRLRLRNRNSEYRNYIGYIGETVNANGGSTCFLGNADTSEPDRSSMLVAMDASGIVDLGASGGVLMEDELFPYGKRTDYKRLAELYKQYLPASSFIVIETGDMARLEAFRDFMSEEGFLSCRRAVLERIDSFMEALAASGGFDTLIFISTYPSGHEAERNNRLTPVIVYGSGGSGLLYSENTRRDGLVLNTDLAGFIEWKLGYSGSSKIKETKREDPLEFLGIDSEEAARVSRLRTPVLTAYAIMSIAAMLMLFAAAVFCGRLRGALVSGAGHIIAYGILTFPVVFLFMSRVYAGDNPVSYVSASAAVATSIAVFTHFVLKDRIKGALFVCTLLLVGLVMDILAGGPYIKQSVLGYDPEIGARFYGIGNEYAGMFIGSSLAAYGSLQELAGRPYGKAVSVLFYSACTLLLGTAPLGANFGGALAGAAGYMLAYSVAYGIKFTKRNILSGIFIFIAAAAMLFIADSLGIGSRSHMGSLVADIDENGFEVIVSTVSRKISMNMRLMRYTIWTKVLLSIIAIIAFMLYRPAKLLKELFESSKYLKCSWMGIAAAGIVGFAVNDSGIVVAATAMIYMIFTLLLMCMGERKEANGLQDSGKH